MGKWYKTGQSDQKSGLPPDPPWSAGHRDHTAYMEGYVAEGREIARIERNNEAGAKIIDLLSDHNYHH